MFDWLFEGRTSVYVILVAFVVFLLLVWWQTRKRWCLIALVIAVGLAGLYALLDKMVETDREQLVRKVNEMAAAMNAHNVEALMANISDNFHSPQGRDKQQLRKLVTDYLDMRMVEKVRVWDIVVVETPSREHPPAKVFFHAKAENHPEFIDCEGTFDFDAEYGWRLQNIEFYTPPTNEKWSFQL